MDQTRCRSETPWLVFPETRRGCDQDLSAEARQSVANTSIWLMGCCGG